MKRFWPGILFLIGLLAAGCGGGGGGGGGEGTGEIDAPGAASTLTTADEEAVMAARATLLFDLFRGENESQDRIREDLSLPVTGVEGTAISWKSSHPAVVAYDGRVTRPGPASADLQVTLTATLSRGAARDEKSFILIVLKHPAGDEDAVAEDAAALTFERIAGANAGPGTITAPLILPAAGANGSAIFWDSSEPDILAIDGAVQRPPFTASDRPVELTGTVRRGSAQKSLKFVLTILRQPASDTEAVAIDAAILGFETIRGGNTDPAAIVADLRLPATGWNGTAITWSSSSTAVGSDGRIVRPPVGSPEAAVILTARIVLGGSAAEKVFHLSVQPLAAGVNFTYLGTGTAIDHPAAGTEFAPATLTYRLDLGGARRDVFFVFTNVAAVNADGYPSITPLASLDSGERRRRARTEAETLVEWARKNGESLSGTPDIDLFNADPWTIGGIGREWRTGPALPQPALLAVDAVGKSGRFYDAWDQPVQATCRKVVAADGKTLNVWVADNSWAGGGCTRTRCVSQGMLDGLADRFLRQGPQNDIFNDVTNIFGDEWGTHSYGNMITPDGSLTLLLMDIQNDNSIYGGILGYFYARDNFRASAHPTSNERLLIALDSVMFANPTGSTWEITDKWPQDFLATLGHELQHMIHFYQKSVRRQTTSQTWLNEMCSLVTEDLLATRLGIAGPRGVAASDGTGGRTGITDGRLGRFDYYNYLSLTDWMDGSVSGSGESNRLNSYSLSYAFGAYLARNYGGAGFFRNLVQNGYGDFRAVEAALSAGGYSDNFARVLQKWGAAVVLSDRSGTEVPGTYRYNAGGFLDSPLDGTVYRLGSVNLFNYSYGGLTGPRIYTLLPQTGIGRPAANIIYRLGTGLTGTISQDITLPKGMRLTVVVK